MAIEEFVRMFESKTKRSGEIFEEARILLPGGVSGSAAYMAPHPVYLERAVGGKIVDVDGNEYIDLLLGGFPNILGHSAPPVIEAVKEQLERGIAPILFTEKGVQLAKKINHHMPYMEMIRFTNTGSEATLSAYRVARSWTKKYKVAKIEGGYNGGHDYVLLSGISTRIDGPPEKPLPVPDCAGIPRFITENTIILPFNNIDASVAIIRENANELAAVMLEPMAGFGMGDVPADPDYIKALREVTQENNVILIYDEVVTGFRIGGMGGAAKYYGVAPDLGCIGKPIGGGFPIGAFGGRRDLMEPTCNPAADPEYKIFQSGTFTGNPVSTTAGLACLTELETKDYKYIDGLADKVRTELKKIAARMGIDMQVTGLGSMFYPHFSPEPIRNQRDRIKADLPKNREFCLGMIVNGVYLPPNHPAAFCFAHKEEDADTVLSVAEKVLNEMKT